MKGSLIRRDPFKALGHWDPWSELRDMQHEMYKWFDSILGKETWSPEWGYGYGYGGWTPSVECYKKGNDLVFKWELPGVDPKDVDLSYDESAHQLVIKGERKTDKDVKEDDYFYREFNYGSFERRFSLPEGVKWDQLKANYTNGILWITVPGAAAWKSKKIEIEAGKPAAGEAVIKKAA